MKRRMTLVALTIIAALAVLDGARAGWTEPHLSAAMGWTVALFYRWTIAE